MAGPYANENFPLPVVLRLRELGHVVLTVQETGKGERSMTDEEVLAFATAAGRAVVTLNRKHFLRLHKDGRSHAGIIACTFDADFDRQALRIHEAVRELATLANTVIRVNRPST